MKALCVFLLVTLVVFASAAHQKPVKHVPAIVRSGKLKTRHTVMTQIQGPIGGKVRGATECDICINFMDQFLNALLNLILNGGIVGGCSALCAAIPGANSLEQAVCNLLCDGVGIDEFINLIDWADLDPVWMCEEIYACKSTTCTSNCATILSSEVNPTNTQAGNTVNYTVSFSVNSPDVGVSSIAVYIVNMKPDKDGNYFDDLELDLMLEPTVGHYIATIPIQTYTSDGMGDNFPFPSGVYNATLYFCEGLCGSEHKGSGEVLAQKVGPNFTLRGGN